MSAIFGRRIVVDFPIYGTSSRSLKKIIVNAATGGAFAHDASERIVVRALDCVSFEFKEGDRVGLVGHNGSGKSTLLRVLAGIYEPSSGQVVVTGRVTSMLSITLGMDMEATGLENIFLRGYVMGVPAGKMRRKVDEIAEFAGIGSYLHLPMKTYSSGMQMRLAFAVSTCLEADVILMDEWLSVGDADFIGKAKARLDSLVKEAKIVVLASHNLDLVKQECNKIVRLEHGRITSIEEQPATGSSSQSV
jgi:lipopolysaccharide transport system ATP-binding protein